MKIHTSAPRTDSILASHIGPNERQQQINYGSVNDACVSGHPCNRFGHSMREGRCGHYMDQVFSHRAVIA